MGDVERDYSDILFASTDSRRSDPPVSVLRWAWCTRRSKKDEQVGLGELLQEFAVGAVGLGPHEIFGQEPREPGKL
jgi:hypothetical protein